MLKDISTIELQGANFINKERLSLLSCGSCSAKSVLVYGRNGSGKSTIAKAFKVIRGDAVPSINSAAALNSSNDPITLTEDEKRHIFIFDEDFVNESVRVQEDGLASIVMLGEQVGLADSIKLAESELTNAEADRDREKAFAEKYKDAKNDKAPLYYIEKMKDILKGNNGWAERDKIIRGNWINTRVSDDTYKDFLSLRPEKTRDELIIEFNNERQKLEAAKNGTAKITAALPAVPVQYDAFDSESGNKLLRKPIEHPVLTEREQYLLALVKGGKGEELRLTAQEFEDTELDRCPKCHQPLSTQYKTDLIASIQKILSDVVKNHQQQLEQFQIPLFEADLSPFRQLPHYQECVDHITEINAIIQNNNALLERKATDPYTPIHDELMGLTDALSALKTAFEQLKNDRDAYNRTVVDTAPIKARLFQINNEIAYYDIFEWAQKHDLQQLEKQTADAEYAASEGVVNAKQRRFEELNAQRNSIDIAIDEINNGLKYIFFSEDRMQIQVENGVYKLLINGHPVRPKDISVGERNIIGLCYFFTDILRKKARDTAFNEEYLLIIDDPVSSYDWENKIGILSYLKYQLGKFLLGNIETRAVLLTHDLMTAIDIEMALRELISECNGKFNRQYGFGFAPYELLECKFKKFENKRNEYSELLKIIYEYANGADNEHGAYIGNIMRQVLEAFATFVYKKGMDQISIDDAILATIEAEEDRIHYKNLMYRLVLNGGSHRRDQTRNMQIDFLAMYSEQEKKRTAKEILCFLYLLNRLHIRRHLNDDVCNTIETWCDSIRTQAGPR